MRIGVVIPFFQREAGILARALRSVAAQELPEGVEVEVVVVDDASPAPAGPEVAAVPMPAGIVVTVLSQPNGGPGAARNRGLDHLAAWQADLVAFLDSDDIWSAAHLREAASAIGERFDLYFCDNVRPDKFVDENDGIVLALKRLRQPSEPGVRWLDSDGSLVAVEPWRLLDGYLETYISQTSTVVLTGLWASRLRFDIRMRNAGEDYMYWIDLALQGAKAVVSSAVNVTCGSGVNVWFSAFDFGSTKVVDRVGYLLVFWQAVSSKLALRQLPTEAADVRVRRYRRAYSYLFTRALLRGQRPSMSLLRMFLREDPLLVVAMPFRFLSVLPRRAAEATTW